MPDRATPNLPSRDLAATSLFYAGLGFAAACRDDGWMILTRGDLVLEFFPWAGLDPAANPCGCCLRLADVDAFAAPEPVVQRDAVAVDRHCVHLGVGHAQRLDGMLDRRALHQRKRHRRIPLLRQQKDVEIGRELECHRLHTRNCT